jgi:hypothetical protein
MDDELEKIEELKREIAEIQASLPAHSVSAAMLLKLEELEEQLEGVLREERNASA